MVLRGAGSRGGFSRTLRRVHLGSYSTIFIVARPSVQSPPSSAPNSQPYSVSPSSQVPVRACPSPSRPCGLEATLARWRVLAMHFLSDLTRNVPCAQKLFDGCKRTLILAVLLFPAFHYYFKLLCPSHITSSFESRRVRCTVSQ